MNAADMLVLVLQTGFVLALALLGGRLASKAPAFRSALYRVAIVAVLALVVASPWLLEREKPVVPIKWSPAVTTVAVTNPPTPQPSQISAQPTSTSAVAAPVETPINVWQFLPWVWGAGVLMLSIQLAFGYLALWRISRRGKPVSEARTLSILTAVSRDAGIATPNLQQAHSVENPFVAGAFKPTIYVPVGWCDRMDDESLGAVLRHEAAHIANGDLRWNLLHRLACIALWPQVLLWLLRRPMNAVSEELCDRHVLASGIPAPRYAQCLLALRENARSHLCPALGIGAVSSRSFLGKRVERILDSRGTQPIVLPKWAAVSLRVVVLGLGATAALLFARPTLQASVADDQDGWNPKPYMGKIRLFGADGKPAQGAAAWLVLNGDIPEPISVP